MADEQKRARPAFRQAEHALVRPRQGCLPALLPTGYRPALATYNLIELFRELRSVGLLMELFRIIHTSDAATGCVPFAIASNGWVITLVAWQNR